MPLALTQSVCPASRCHFSSTLSLPCLTARVLARRQLQAVNSFAMQRRDTSRYPSTELWNYIFSSMPTWQPSWPRFRILAASHARTATIACD
ncbi:hypothetical protein BCR44DRAFT_63565 [Catenaria anguillulae PL171]|uniref:Uncharacterized protein n=1 Tax=Catenaria anguillulae PL171 TaxID=765915 RepID=A0A1Y2H736_9FUNG|nr:hypothetical protein BCR44DRAFT_63565 [Catenaria anguillulae PL171]